MDGFAAVDFGFAREVLQRGIAVIFLIAFVSTANQFPALAGERGLLPAPRLLAWVAHSRARWRMLPPTLFRIVRYTDARLRALCGAGVVVAAALAAGIPQLGPPWVPMLCFLALWAGYQSVCAIGQEFYGFGWEMLLCEAGFLAAFLGSASQPPTVVSIVLLQWLVVRLEFGAGMIKIRGGREWRDLTALMYHHETQPMPGPFSRTAHLLPPWFHRGEVVANHISQLVFPWLLFAPLLGLVVPGPVPATLGAVGAAVVVGTQLWLVVTGNFAWLNAATVVLAFSAVGFAGVGFAAGGADAATRPDGGIPIWWLVITSAVGLLYVVLSVPAARNLASTRQRMNASFWRWRLANAYGAFGTVTRTRVEYIVEGTLDPDPTTATWVAYPFRGKPGDVMRRPRQWAPYHLRLDWMMWFLPLGRPLDGWFTTFLSRLADADPATLRLLASDPFGGRRPHFVRVVSYRYRFADRAEHRASGAVWVRDRRQLLVRPFNTSAGNG